MSSCCLTIGDLFADSFDLLHPVMWGDGTLTFEDKDNTTLFTITSKWNATRVGEEATGQSEMEVVVLPQANMVEAVLQSTVRFIVLQGRRYEKRTYEFLPGLPERHKIRMQPVGEFV